MTGVLALTVKAAIDEKESIARLSVALKNVGIDYNNVRASIQQVIDAQTKKTNYSDEQQRDALQQLVLITGNYDLSLRALPAVLDLAAAKQIDVSSAAVLMAKAMNGNTEALKRYGIEVPKDASASDVLNAILLKVKGTAEATANPFTILKNSLHSLAASIGETILPTITSLVNWITNVVDWFKKWAEAHPELVRYGTLFAGTLGLIATAIGPLLIMFPMVVTGLRSIMAAFFGVQAAAGPVGWIFLGISVAISAAIPYFTKLIGETRNLKQSFMDLEAQSFRTQIQQHSLTDEWTKLQEQGYITKQQFDDLATSLGITTEKLYKYLLAAGMLDDTLASVGDTNVYLKKTVDATAQSLQDAERDLSRAASDAISSYMDKFRTAHDEKMQALQDEYDARIATINLELDAALSGYESEIEALYGQIDAIDKAQQKKRDDERKAQLEAAVANATTDDERAAAQKDLDDFLSQLSDQQKKDEINAQIDEIRQEEENARAHAKDEEQQAKDTYETKKKLLTDEYNDSVTFLTAQKALYDTAATEQSQRYKDDYAAFIKLLDDKELAASDFVDQLNKIYAGIQSSGTAGATGSGTGATGGGGGGGGSANIFCPGSVLSVPVSTWEADSKAKLAAMEATNQTAIGAVAKVVAKVATDTTPVKVVAIPAPVSPVGPVVKVLPQPLFNPAATDTTILKPMPTNTGALANFIAGFQHGGIIGEPTLLSRLSDFRPYGIAGENGPEYLGPNFPSVNIHIDEMSVRKQSDIDEIAEALVNKIRLRTGMKV